MFVGDLLCGIGLLLIVWVGWFLLLFDYACLLYCWRVVVVCLACLLFWVGNLLCWLGWLWCLVCCGGDCSVVGCGVAV